MLLDMALDEDSAASWVDPAGDVQGRGGQGVLPEVGGDDGVVGEVGQGVEVDDAEGAGVRVLEARPVGDRSQPVAEVEGARRLDAGEDRWLGLGLFRGGGGGGGRGVREEAGRGEVGEGEEGAGGDCGFMCGMCVSIRMMLRVCVLV